MDKGGTGNRIGHAAAWLLAAGLALSPIAALAHPHVFVTVRSEIVYEPDGRAGAIRHVWDFDEAYSAFSVQGLDKDGDGKVSGAELSELAKTNVESLADFEYFTVVKANGAKQAFGAPRDYALSHDGKTLRLTFTLPLASPAPGRLVGLEVYDPTFFVAFDLSKDEDAVKLAGAPKGCAITVTRPKGFSLQQSLSEAFFESLGPNATFGVQYANKALAACP